MAFLPRLPGIHRRAVLFVVVLLSTAVLAAPRAAEAHAPISLGWDHTTPDSAQPLGDPSSAGLIYGQLLPYGAQYVSFSIAPGQPFHALVLSPLDGGGLNPSVAIVGPGLGDPSGAPFAVPDGDGVMYLPAPDAPVPIFIADLGLRFLAGAGYDGPLPGGDYLLVAYSGDGSYGGYTAGTGYGP